jgi:hypothetical protein
MWQNICHTGSSHLSTVDLHGKIMMLEAFQQKMGKGQNAEFLHFFHLSKKLILNMY